MDDEKKELMDSGTINGNKGEISNKIEEKKIPKKKITFLSIIKKKVILK